VRLLLSSILFMSLAGVSKAGPLEVNPTGVGGHHIGETASAFLAIEPKTRGDLGSCRQNSALPHCDRLLDALERGQRAEISTSDSLDFVFDQGRLVKLAALVDGIADSLAMDLTKTLGPRTSEMDIQKQNGAGAKWNDNLSVWDAPNAYVLLFEDNNPSLNARHPVLVVESPTEHARTSSDSAKRNNSNKKGLQKVFSRSEPGVLNLDF
jgi:hypothetical protein